MRAWTDHAGGRRTAVEILGRSVELGVDAQIPRAHHDAAADYAVSMIERHYTMLEDNLVDSLLDDYNDDWAAADERPELDRAGFLAQIRLESVDCMGDSARPNQLMLSMIFDTGDLFGGHYAKIVVDGPDVWPARLHG